MKGFIFMKKAAFLLLLTLAFQGSAFAHCSISGDPAAAKCMTSGKSCCKPHGTAKTNFVPGNRTTK